MEEPKVVATYREGQVAMSLLAHAARRDFVFLAASLEAIADPAEDLRPMGVLAVLLAEFAHGVDEGTAEDMAEWYMSEARNLADKAAHPAE